MKFCKDTKNFIMQFIYIIELKYGKNAQEAIDQIVGKDYAARFAHDPRPITAIGLNISHDRRTIDDTLILPIN